MKTRLLVRLARLEAQVAERQPLMFRYGWLIPLPKDFTGERHIALLSHEPTINPLVEWCVFEERPGKGPIADDSDGMTVFLTEPPEPERRILQ